MIKIALRKNLIYLFFRVKIKRKERFIKVVNSNTVSENLFMTIPFIYFDIIIYYLMQITGIKINSPAPQKKTVSEPISSKPIQQKKPIANKNNIKKGNSLKSETKKIVS